LTQSALAQQAQLSIDTLRLLENGSGNLSSFWAVLNTLNLAIVGRNLPAGQHMGEQMTTLRKRKGLSQRKLSKLVGVSQPTLIELERHAGGRLQTLDRVLAALGVEASLAPTPSAIQCQIHEENAFTFLPSLPAETFQLIFTSPPYNMGKVYEDKTSLEAYLEPYKRLIPELARVLKPGGSVCWEVGHSCENGESVPLDMYFYPLFRENGLLLRNRIIWRFGHGYHATKRFSSRYETILWFTKGDDYTFNLDNIRVPAKYPGKTYTKGPKKGQLSGNPLGVNPGNVWEILLQDWAQQLWDIPNVKSHHPEKTIHPCQFPVELAERCILALTDRDAWVLDPFMGAGSTLIAAYKHQRHSVGIEKESLYCDIARERLEALRNGTLHLRPMTKPIQQPTAKIAMAKIPEEWNNLPGSIYYNTSRAS
jgi:adenine-specific DNA-methyltransferase